MRPFKIAVFCILFSLTLFLAAWSNPPTLAAAPSEQYEQIPEKEKAADLCAAVLANASYELQCKIAGKVTAAQCAQCHSPAVIMYEQGQVNKNEDDESVTRTILPTGSPDRIREKWKWQGGA